MHKDKPRILFFVPLPPPVHGAALRNKSLVDSKILNANFNIKVLPFNFVASVNDIGKLSLRKSVKFFTRAFSILFAMISFKPHLVYFNFSVYGFALYRDFLYALIFKAFNVKIIFHLRTQGVREQANASQFKKWMFKKAFQRTFVICLSDFLAKDISDVYKPVPIIVNNGIENMCFGAKENHQPVPSILFLSNLSVTKGILDLIEAFSIIKDKGISFTGSVVGNDGDLTKTQIQKELSNRGLTDCVQVLGPKYGQDKFEILSLTDIFVFPTIFEAFPGVVLEAMQFGIPVVSTFEGAIPEIIDDGVTGLLVQKKDTIELANKLALLIGDIKMRRTLGENSRAKFKTHYTLEAFEKNMLSAFNRILWEPRTP